MLSQLSSPIPESGLFNSVHELWDKDTFPNPEPADYKMLLSENSREPERRKIFKSLLKHGFAYISGTPTEHAATVRACRALTVTQPNCFGDDWSFTADLEKPDTGELKQLILIKFILNIYFKHIQTLASGFTRMLRTTTNRWAFKFSTCSITRAKEAKQCSAMDTKP